MSKYLLCQELENFELIRIRELCCPNGQPFLKFSLIHEKRFSNSQILDKKKNTDCIMLLF